MMKKAFAILLILAMALSLCACGKTAITGEEFCSRMQGLGLETHRNDILVNSDDTVLDAYTGGPEDASYVVRYYELVSEEQARSDFLSTQTLEGGTTTTVNSTHSAFFSQKTSEDVLMIAYVENTLLIGFGAASQYDTLKDVFETMGYK